MLCRVSEMLDRDAPVFDTPSADDA
jgi:hypothetical protein